MIKGEHLKIARYIYGYPSQEMLADELGVSLATIQRYESMDDVDAKVLQKYVSILRFDLLKIVMHMDNLRYQRQKSLTTALKV